MTATIVVGPLADLADGTAVRVDLEGHRVALVRVGDDVYALGDQCSHADVSLAEGEVDPDERTIECWKHGSTFDLTTGEPTCLPATRPVPVYEVSIVDQQIVVTLS